MRSPTVAPRDMIRYARLMRSQDGEIPVDAFQREHLARGEAVRLARLRAMTPTEKMAAAARLYWSARRLKAGYLRSLHPEWSDARVEEEVKLAFLYHRD